jgi:hypothetical protein
VSLATKNGNQRAVSIGKIDTMTTPTEEEFTQRVLDDFFGTYLPKLGYKTETIIS